jgi:hypothetical protein
MMYPRPALLTNFSFETFNFTLPKLNPFFGSLAGNNITPLPWIENILILLSPKW